MPAHKKYTDEQRSEVRELYKMGRGKPVPGERPRGYYSLKDIEEITGVPAKTAWMIARGHR